MSELMAAEYKKNGHRILEAIVKVSKLEWILAHPLCTGNGCGEQRQQDQGGIDEKISEIKSSPGCTFHVPATFVTGFSSP